MASSEREEVLSVLQEQEAATARGDARAAVAPLAHDVVLYDLPPPLQYRGEDARDTGELERWYATWEDGVTVKMADPQVVIDGDLAVVFGLVRMQGVKKGEGLVDSWSRRTSVLLRREGRWQIVHEHGSYPMLMDGSGKAATDLKP